MAALSIASSLTATHNNVSREEQQSDTVDESTSLNIEMKHEDEEQETVMEGCVVEQQDEELLTADNFKPTDTDDSSSMTTTAMVSCVLYIYIQTLTECKAKKNLFEVGHC